MPTRSFVLCVVLLTSINTVVLGQGFAYVGNSEDDNVAVIDLETQSIVDYVLVGGSPSAVAVSSDANFVYVANRGSFSVSVIDASTNLVVDTVDLSVWPFGIAVNPVLPRLYIGGPPGVSVIDTATNTEIAVVEIGTSPIGVAVTPAGDRLYVAETASNTVFVVDTSTNEVIDSVTGITGGPQNVVVGTLNRAYSINLGSSVTVIDTATNVVLDTISVGNVPFGAALSPDGDVPEIVEIRR